MDNRQNRFPGPDEGFPEDMDEMEDLNPALPDADEILDGLGEDFRFGYERKGTPDPIW